MILIGGHDLDSTVTQRCEQRDKLSKCKIFAKALIIYFYNFIVNIQK